MRTKVIPAQITTVEDRIAGSLSLIQILLLMIPIFWTVVVYAIFVPSLHFSWYKLPLVLFVLFVCFTLSLRIKGKLVLNWLVVILRFNLRPKYYVFDKNDEYLRILYVPELEKKSYKFLRVKRKEDEKIVATPNFGEKDLIQLENFIKRRKLRLSFKTSKKGGINVAFEQIQK